MQVCFLIMAKRRALRASALLTGSTDFQVKCVYSPFEREDRFWKLVDPLPSADLVVLNATKNELFIPYLSRFLGHKGKVLAISEDPEFAANYLLRKYRVEQS